MDTNENTDDAVQETVPNPEHMPGESPAKCVTNADDTAQETAQNSGTTSDNSGNTSQEETVRNADIDKPTESEKTAEAAIDIGAVANDEGDNSSDTTVISSDDEERSQINKYNRYRLFIIFLQLLNLMFALYQMLAIGVNWDCITCKLEYNMFSAQYYNVFGTLVPIRDIINFCVGSSVFVSNSVGIIGYCIDSLALILIYALLMVMISTGCLALSQYVFGGYTLVVSALAWVFVFVFLFNIRRDLLPSRNIVEQRTEEMGAESLI